MVIYLMCSCYGSIPNVWLPWLQMFEHVLSELGPWCLAEQDFCVRFFNLEQEADKSAKEVGVELKE